MCSCDVPIHDQVRSVIIVDDTHLLLDTGHCILNKAVTFDLHESQSAVRTRLHYTAHVDEKACATVVPVTLTAALGSRTIYASATGVASPIRVLR